MSDRTDIGIVVETGRRVAAARVARQLTQDQFADAAGVGRSTVQRLERGESIQLTSFVKILRALDRLDAFDAVLPSESRSPLAELERERRRPQRVRPRRGGNDRTSEQATTEDSAPHDAPPWTWGDA